MALKELVAAIDELAADPAALADGESVVELHRQLARLDAVTTQATGAFEAEGEWAAVGARSAVAFLTTRTHLPKHECRRRLGLAKAAGHLPAFAAAWTAGDVAAAHVRVVANVRREETEAALARDEELLVGHAKELRFDSYVRAVDYWEQLADPDGAEDDHDRRRKERDVWLEQSWRGVWLGGMHLDPISGEVVSGRLRAIEDELFRADWAEAKQRLGRDPLVTELERTPAQRRADALVEMAVRAGTAPADGRRPAPLFTVLVDFPTLSGRVCELASGMVVPPGSLLPWLTEAYIERAVWKPDRRVEVSKTARLFGGATRRGIDLRDRECFHPYCDEPAAHCEGDHVTPYSEGGETTQLNGRPGCRFHNNQRERERRGRRRDKRRRRNPPGGQAPDTPDPPAA